MTSADLKLIVSFRGKKVEILFDERGISVGNVKQRVIAKVDGGASSLTPSDIKLMHKGKILMDDTQDLYQLLVVDEKKATKTTFKLMATGVSPSEAASNNQEFQEALKHAPRIRDDLTAHGKKEIARRQQLGRNLLNTSRKVAPKYGFRRIETLPLLPDQAKAKSILQTLANDPGVLACMAKHKWNVGSLAELYPEGKVGESEVCVMGLNRNKGQQILLRIRTDDLKGFRKMLSIRKVLYHELAHNVHSEHNGDFFQLMRQIERECNELDWTQGAGLSSAVDGDEGNALYSGGSYRLGGGEASQSNVSVRELAARAAMLRMTAEEEEIQEHCGCGKKVSVMPTMDVNETEDEDENGASNIEEAKRV